MDSNVRHSAAHVLRPGMWHGIRTLTCARRDGAGFAGLGGFWCFSGVEASASNEGACLGFHCCSWLFTVCTPSAFNVLQRNGFRHPCTIPWTSCCTVSHQPVWQRSVLAWALLATQLLQGQHSTCHVCSADLTKVSSSAQVVVCTWACSDASAT